MPGNERAYEVQEVKLLGPGATDFDGGDLHNENLGNNPDALHRAVEVLSQRTKQSPNTPFCEVRLVLRANDGEGPQSFAALSVTDGVLYLTVSA